MPEFTSYLIMNDTILATTLVWDTGLHSVSVTSVEIIGHGDWRYAEILQGGFQGVAVQNGAGAVLDGMGQGEGILGDEQGIPDEVADLAEGIYWISNEDQTAMKAWIPL